MLLEIQLAQLVINVNQLIHIIFALVSKLKEQRFDIVAFTELHKRIMCLLIIGKQSVMYFNGFFYQCLASIIADSQLVQCSLEPVKLLLRIGKLLKEITARR